MLLVRFIDWYARLLVPVVIPFVMPNRRWFHRQVLAAFFRIVFIVHFPIAPFAIHSIAQSRLEGQVQEHETRIDGLERTVDHVKIVQEYEAKKLQAVTNDLKIIGKDISKITSSVSGMESTINAEIKGLKIIGGLFGSVLTILLTIIAIQQHWRKR